LELAERTLCVGAHPVRAVGRYIAVNPLGGNSRIMSILWIILIVVLVLALLGFFGRGRL
jgi:hypothetical protein